MKIKQFFIFSILFIFTTSFTSISFANDVENESNETDVKNTILETSANDLTKEPSISSRAAVVIDRTSNRIIFGKNENEVRKMASTTKIMTAIVIIENHDLTDTVTVSKKAAGTGGSRLGLKAGDKITVLDLLHGLMLCSGNDAAVCLAEYSAESVENFAKKMNQKAKDLGLKHTQYVTPHGLDNEEHFTTAYELALLTNYALQNKTFKSIVGTKAYTVSINEHPKKLRNTNELLGVLNGVYGVKTGFTNGANRCLVTSTKRGDLDIICVVLGADTKKIRTKDSTKLIEYTFKNYETVALEEKIKSEFNNWVNCSNFEIIKGCNNNLDLQLQDIPYKSIVLKKGQDISFQINATYIFSAPLNENTHIGTLQVKSNNKILLELNITNSNKIEKKNIFFTFGELCKNYRYNLENF